MIPVDKEQTEIMINNRIPASDCSAIKTPANIKRAGANNLKFNDR